MGRVTKKKAKPLSPRAAAKLEAWVATLEAERKEERRALLSALGVEKYVEDMLADFESRLSDLESRFW